MLIAFCSDGPVIEQEQTHIKTSAGEEIHITCEVHAFPPPLVTWTRYTWEDIKALYQYIVWSFKFPRNGRLMSENSEGVVMSQSDNRYNLILLGSHLSHPAIGKLFLSNIIHLHSELSFWVCFTLFSQQKIFINRKLNFLLKQNYHWVNLPWQWWWDYVGTLVINESFYGEYGCQAVNELGVASKSLQVSGEEMSVSLFFAGSVTILEKFVNLWGSVPASLA